MLFLFPAMAAAAGPGQCSAFTADLIDECYLEKFGFPATSFVPADDPVECTDEPSTGLIFKDAGIAEADAPTAVLISQYHEVLIADGMYSIFI